MIDYFTILRELEKNSLIFPPTMVEALKQVRLAEANLNKIKNKVTRLAYAESLASLGELSYRWVNATYLHIQDEKVQAGYSAIDEEEASNSEDDIDINEVFKNFSKNSQLKR